MVVKIILTLWLNPYTAFLRIVWIKWDNIYESALKILMLYKYKQLIVQIVKHEHLYFWEFFSCNLICIFSLVILFIFWCIVYLCKYTTYIFMQYLTVIIIWAIIGSLYPRRCAKYCVCSGYCYFCFAFGRTDDQIRNFPKPM